MACFSTPFSPESFISFDDDAGLKNSSLLSTQVALGSAQSVLKAEAEAAALAGFGRALFLPALIILLVWAGGWARYSIILRYLVE